jgi:predicted ArsR family transcriptional regulator
VTPRLRVLDAIRHGLRTVNGLAAQLGVTDNAVRGHLAALERDGLVRAAGVVRSGVAGKPAAEYEVTSEAELSLSRAYAPALEALVEALASRLDPRALRAAFRDAGRRLAPAATSPPASLAAGAEVARDLLTELGGCVDLDVGRSEATVRGNGCPLAAAVARVPATCTIVESMLASTTGRHVEQRCNHGPRPNCAFRVT